MTSVEAAIKTVNDLDELKQLLANSLHPVLLQFSSHTCPRCPAFAEAIASDARNYSFEHRLVMVTEAPELVEEYQIASLPAFTILPPASASTVATPQVFQAATVELAKACVRACCVARFDLESDF